MAGFAVGRTRWDRLLPVVLAITAWKPIPLIVPKILRWSARTVLSPTVLGKTVRLAIRATDAAECSRIKQTKIMSNASQAQAERTSHSRQSDRVELPGENLTLQETLRVMDVAREMRQQRETAEEMFRRDDIRNNLRDKLMRTARMSGDDVTEAEIEAAIDQYFDTVHTYEDPAAGLNTFMAHCWIWRDRILMGAVSIAVAAGGLWFLFG